MRRYKLLAEQNLEPIEDAFKVFQDTLVGLKRLQNEPNWMGHEEVQDTMLFVDDQGALFLYVHGQLASMTIVKNVMDKLRPS